MCDVQSRFSAPLQIQTEYTNSMKQKSKVVAENVVSSDKRKCRNRYKAGGQTLSHGTVSYKLTQIRPERMNETDVRNKDICDV